MAAATLATTFRLVAAAPVPSGVSPVALNLPTSFVGRVEARLQIDRYQRDAYTLEQDLPAKSYPPDAKRSSERQGVLQVLRSQPPEAVLRYRRAIPPETRPLRGFRAPLLELADREWPVTLSVDDLPEPAGEAARIVETRLAHEGLIPAFVRVLHALGGAACRTNVPQTLTMLRRVGFPVDWLAAFTLPTVSGRPAAPEEWVAHAAGALGRDTVDEVIREVARASRFEFHPTVPGFEAVDESGSQPIGLVRAQCGGGYRQGIVPGSSLDFLGRLVEAMPDARLVVSVESDYLEAVRWLAGRVWSLKRRGQLLLIGEPYPVAGWAQDNGKAGTLPSPEGGAPMPAVVIPRFASLGDADSRFMPGESFLMEGVQSAGIRVVHSPLLFQGGSILVVREPRRRERIALLGEAEVYRNVALGLTREQVLRAFQLELGVDRCVVLPSGSYHLDFDVTVRLHQGRLIAFVNDPSAGAQRILQAGVEALIQSKLLQGEEAERIQATFTAAAWPQFGAAVHQALSRVCNGRGEIPATLVQAFAKEDLDAPGANLRCFLSAVDWLARDRDSALARAGGEERASYLAAIRTLEQTLADQRRQLEDLGWAVCGVPSLPDLLFSLNYVNGIHEPDRYFMPAYGGFYGAADQAAAEAFARALDGQPRVVPLLCSDSQRAHGAVHCLVSAYPGPLALRAAGSAAAPPR